MNISIKIETEVDGQIEVLERIRDIKQSWNDLSLEQQLTCYTLIKTDTGQLLEVEEVIPYKRIQLAQYLLRFDDDFMELWEQDCIDTYGGEDGVDVFLEELDKVLVATDFLWDKIEQENEEEEISTLYQIKLGLTKCPFPVLEQPREKRALKQNKNRKKRGKLRRYYAPTDELDNINIYELGMLFTLFEDFMKTQEVEYAHRLLATLYRPAKPITRQNKQSGYQGDRRLPLLDHESTIHKRMKLMETLPLPVKHLIIFWFASCRQHIIESNRELLPEQQEGDKGSGYGWGDVILNLAGGLINLEKISQQNYQNVFLYLNKLENDAKMRVLRNA